MGNSPPESADCPNGVSVDDPRQDRIHDRSSVAATSAQPTPVEKPVVLTSVASSSTKTIQRSIPEPRVEFVEELVKQESKDGVDSEEQAVATRQSHTAIQLKDATPRDGLESERSKVQSIGDGSVSTQRDNVCTDKSAMPSSTAATSRADCIDHCDIEQGWVKLEQKTKQCVDINKAITPEPQNPSTDDAVKMSLDMKTEETSRAPSISRKADKCENRNISEFTQQVIPPLTSVERKLETNIETGSMLLGVSPSKSVTILYGEGSQSHRHPTSTNGTLSKPSSTSYTNVGVHVHVSGKLTSASSEEMGRDGKGHDATFRGTPKECAPPTVSVEKQLETENTVTSQGTLRPVDMTVKESTSQQLGGQTADNGDETTSSVASTSEPIVYCVELPVKKPVEPTSVDSSSKTIQRSISEPSVETVEKLVELEGKDGVDSEEQAVATRQSHTAIQLKDATPRDGLESERSKVQSIGDGSNRWPESVSTQRDKVCTDKNAVPSSTTATSRADCIDCDEQGDNEQSRVLEQRTEQHVEVSRAGAPQPHDPSTDDTKMSHDTSTEERGSVPSVSREMDKCGDQCQTDTSVSTQQAISSLKSVERKLETRDRERGTEPADNITGNKETDSTLLGDSPRKCFGGTLSKPSSTSSTYVGVCGELSLKETGHEANFSGITKKAAVPTKSFENIATCQKTLRPVEAVVKETTSQQLRGENAGYGSQSLLCIKPIADYIMSDEQELKGSQRSGIYVIITSIIVNKVRMAVYKSTQTRIARMTAYK